MPTPVRLQHADGRTVEMWLEDDHRRCARILINGKWFRATDDATPTYTEEPEVATSSEAVDKGSAQLMIKFPDRRRAERREETFLVSVTTPAPVEIAGQSVDFTSFGVLLTAHGQISVQLKMKGKQYQGRLVRAFPMESGATAYGIELEETLESTETEQH